MTPPLSKSQIWRLPLALGFVSAVGLVAALLADGIGDVVSWMALAAPVAVAVWYAVRPARCT
jgi:hypothetical protein